MDLVKPTQLEYTAYFLYNIELSIMAQIKRIIKMGSALVNILITTVEKGRGLKGIGNRRMVIIQTARENLTV